MKITKITLDMLKNSSWYKPEQLSWFETNLPNGIELTRKAVKALEDVIPVDLAESIEDDFRLRRVNNEIDIECDSEEDYALRMIANIFIRDFQGEDAQYYVPEDITPEEAEVKRYSELIERIGNLTEETEDDCYGLPLYYANDIYRVLADAFYALDSANKYMSYNHANMSIYGYMRHNIASDLRDDKSGYMIARISDVRFRIPMSMFRWIMRDVCRGVFASRLMINGKKASEFFFPISEDGGLK